MLEEMRAFVSQNRNGNDVQRYYANLVLELMAMIGSGKVFFGSDPKNPISAGQLFDSIIRGCEAHSWTKWTFNSIKQAVRC